MPSVLFNARVTEADDELDVEVSARVRLGANRWGDDLDEVEIQAVTRNDTGEDVLEKLPQAVIERLEEQALTMALEST